MVPHRNDTYKKQGSMSSSPPEDPPSKFPAPLVHLRGSGSAWTDEGMKTTKHDTSDTSEEVDTPLRHSKLEMFLDLQSGKVCKSTLDRV